MVRDSEKTKKEIKKKLGRVKPVFVSFQLAQFLTVH